MLELDTNPHPAAIIFVVLAIYNRMKPTFATVPVIEADAGQEKGLSDSEELARVRAADCHTLRTAPTSQHKALTAWSLCIVPINLIVWYLTNIAWVATPRGAVNMWHFMVLSLLPFCPVVGALRVLRYSYLLSRQNARTYPHNAEKYRVQLRGGMLDGAVLAPVAAIYAAYIYPERMLNESCVPGAWAAAYASQSVVWAHFFYQSRRQSREMFSTRVPV